MRKVLAILVSFVVIFAMIPTMAFAVDTPITLTDADISIADMTYTGEELTPVVKYGTKILTAETDYAIEITKDGASASVLNAGTYQATIKQVNDSDYTIATDIVKSFKVNPKNGLSLSAAIPDQKVGVAPDFSTVVIKDGTKTLVSGTDYTISYEGNTVAGSNWAKIIFKDNYTGTKDTYFAGKYDLARCYTFASQYTAENPKEYTYSKGTKIKPAMMPSKASSAPSGTPAITASDYTIEYSENEQVTKGITATIKATSSGKFMGTISNVPTYVSIIPKNINSSGISISVETSSDESTAPAVTIKDGVTKLELGKDYCVSVIPGEKKIRIEGQGNYTGAVDKPFTVATKEITDVTFTPVVYTYNKASQKPAVTVKSNGATVPTDGYRIDWPSDTTSVGSKEFTVVGIGDYYGQIKQSYIITAQSISKLDISLSATTFSYTGKEIKPVVTVKDGSTVLKENTDYTLSYSNHVAGPTATVTVEMKGNYYGTKDFTYSIGKTSIAGFTLSLDKTSYAYTGSEIKPAVTVKNGSKTVSSAYYSVAYSNNINVGTGTVTVTGKNGYYGTLTATFSITGKTISNCTITLSQTKYDADGTEKKPAVTVKDGTKTLVNGTDYTVTYANNKTAGQASVTITGKGAYGGTKTEYFTITGKYQYVEVEQDTYTKYPTSSPFKLAPTCNGDGTGFTFTSSDSSVASVAADGTVTLKAPGKAVITIATKGDIKYTPASEIVTITVKPNKGSLAKLGTPAKRSLRVYINKRAGVDGYQVRYTRGTGYKYFTVKHVTSVYKTQYRTVRYLKSGYTYKVQVRAYKILDDGTKLYGSWSTAKSIKVK